MNTFLLWLMSPLSEFHLASLNQKVIAGAAGAGTAYYLHKYKHWPTWKVALTSAGVAWGSFMLLRASSRFAPLGQTPSAFAPIGQTTASFAPTQDPMYNPVVQQQQSAPASAPYDPMTGKSANVASTFDAASPSPGQWEVDEGMAGDDGGIFE